MSEYPTSEEVNQQQQDLAVAHLAQMRKTAEKGMAQPGSEDRFKRCIEGEPMLWFPYHRALVPGHIYSQAGLKEARISGCCEYHFDRMFEPGWVDAVTGEPGLMPDEDEEPSDG